MQVLLKNTTGQYFFFGLAMTMQLIGWWVIGGYAASLLPWICPVRVSRALCFSSKVSDSVGFTQTEGFQWRLRDIRLINCEQQNNLFWQLTWQWQVSAYGRMLHVHEYYTIPAQNSSVAPSSQAYCLRVPTSYDAFTVPSLNMSTPPQSGLAGFISSTSDMRWLSLWCSRAWSCPS